MRPPALRITAETRLQPANAGLALYMREEIFKLAAVKPMSQVGGGGEPLRLREATTMTMLLTAAFAIVAALVALISVLTPTAGGYQLRVDRKDYYEIAINLNDLGANRQMATVTRTINCDEPA